MDQDRFDRITRTLASSQSRRGVLKGLVGSALGGTLAAMGLASGAAKPAGKVAVCHFDATTGLYAYITVARSAVPAHEAHGDAIAPDFATDPDHCGGCGMACDDGLECCNGTCTDRAAYQHDDPANCGGCGIACACLDGDCIDVLNDVANCGAVHHDCRVEYSSDDYYCEEGACLRLCDGQRDCADGDCYYECLDPPCGATEGQCRRAHEVCCPSGDRIFCFGPDTCPENTQRFIGVR